MSERSIKSFEKIWLCADSMCVYADYEMYVMHTLHISNSVRVTKLLNLNE